MTHTPICDLLGIRYPVLQGGMAWVSDAALAAAVSNAGGLGIISAMSLQGEALRAEIRRARQLTAQPFGVNIMLMSPYVAEVAQVVAEEAVPVVTTGAGNAAPFMKAWLAAGIKVVPVVPSVAMAIFAVRAGACAVIAEGGESGGHVGELTTMALVPQVCDAVNVPVIAAGGIADGRGVAAAFMLGATGVQLGTRFLVATECGIHPAYKEKVLVARDIDTLVTGRKLGHPVRSLRSKFSVRFARMEGDGVTDNDTLEEMGSGALRRAARDGDTENGCFMAGQAAALVKKEQSAEAIVRELMADTETILKGATAWLQ